MDKSYRIHTNIISDTMLQVNMKQDFDFLEVLSLKLRQKDAYRIHSSNYGVIVGRVLANDAFGIPNAKISVFVERDESDSTDMEALYPYMKNTSKDNEGRRYNLLPDYSDDDCYRIVGTFPNKRLMLDDDVQLEVYDKYYKFTTVTNNAGDYMLFGVPAEGVQIHVDIDLSDIGVLSQKPRDFEYKGYNLTEFDSPSQFKESTNLDSLAQIFSQDKAVTVYPFWGDADNGIACITRSDIQINYKFEPTCVFMGSIVSDNEGHAIGHKCAPDVESGMNNQLIGGNGTIEMIRKTVDGLVEEFPIQGNQLIDDNGVWCYQIPMNLDFIGTDEYGNVVPTDNPNKGIPTRTQVRFRFSKTETTDEGFSRHTAKYLVPMNPIFSEERNNLVKASNGAQSVKGTIPVIMDKGSDIEQMYVFGSGTPEHCFRDLYWNNVYSVKNYIPKTQVATKPYSKNYNGLKGSNLADDQNPIPFNKLRVDIPFAFTLMCLLFTMVMWIVLIINEVFSGISKVFGLINKARDFTLVKILGIKIKPLSILPPMPIFGCIPLSAGLSEGNVAYYPGCDYDESLKKSRCPDDMEGECTRSNDKDELLDKVQRNLALDYKIIKLDLYQDWINGCLYMPLWYWRKAKKKKFLFFTIRGAKNEYCSDSTIYKKKKMVSNYVTCNIRYTSDSLGVKNNKNSMPESEDRWHKRKAGRVRYQRGLIKPVENRDGLTAYYYSALQATNDNVNPSQAMAERPSGFKAVRLFATDIILLGNLDPKNLYGIPQFFTCLPSTTANIPPMATVEQSDESSSDDEKEVNDVDIAESELNEEDESGIVLVTGMDWSHDGHKQSPKYKTGLFLDLACTKAATRPKACINVERLSELGVNLDMTYDMPYHEGGSDIKYGTMYADGFITKLELDDMENRAMFATMNHIGFIPQTYQDSISGYTTQVQDKNTNYFVPKFKYIYPVDFDGRLQETMQQYSNGFDQAMYDEQDESYITFRLGAEKGDDKTKNSEGRIRHFYHISDGLYDMPLYNNSYYFYFGVKKGSTAIDKFNQMFYAPCFQNNKMPFSLVVTSQGKSYCPEAYSNSLKDNAYGWIEVKSDDIRPEYTYTLYDSLGDIVVSESGMTAEKFVIGGTYDNEGSIKPNEDGHVKKQIPNSQGVIEDVCLKTNANGTCDGIYVLDNQEYILELTDADGKSISQKVTLSKPKISGEYTATRLGTRFYDSATTRIDYICNDENQFYGKIEMTSFSVDGYECTINNIESVNYTEKDEKNREVDEYSVIIVGESDEIGTVKAELRLGVTKKSDENKMRNCLCDNNGVVNLIRAEQEDVAMNIKGTSDFKYYLAKTENGIVFYVYQPNNYYIKITQICKDEVIEDNSSIDTVTVLNGEPFLTYLNTMPTRFMLGTSNDNVNGAVSNGSHFYKTSCETNPKSVNIRGWYGLHEEDTYLITQRKENRTFSENQTFWEDILKGARMEISTPEAKRNVIKYKFDTMFALCQGAYITNDSSMSLRLSSSGGVSPILYRTVAPKYDDATKISNTYILKDSSNITCNEIAPNIVGCNYYKASGANSAPEDRMTKFGGGEFNSVFTDNNSNELTKNKKLYVGNYFAAFTKDGGYTSKSQIDGKIKIERSPSYASISPIKDNKLKTKGKDETGEIINYFGLAHTKGSQKLPNDSSRTVLPYLRGMFVDRRFDYDLVILAPSVGSSFDLYVDTDKEKGKERIWKSGRISGWTYNGIEMSYDEDYNIVSADTHSTELDGDLVYSAATFNKRLEYTYKYDCGHKCLACGKQFYKEGEILGICPKCQSDNIAFFGGDKLNDRGEHEVDNVNFYEKNENEGNIPPTIGANNNGTNKRYAFDDAITYYHRWYGGFIGTDGKTYTDPEKYEWNGEDDVNYPKWGEWNYIMGLDANGDPKKYGVNWDETTKIGRDIVDSQVPLFKEFYSSTLYGMDIRHLYWSLFNYRRLRDYTEMDGPNDQTKGYGEEAIKDFFNPLYVYHYPYDNIENWCNGDFNRDHACIANDEHTKGNLSYPTKRFIDIGNLPPIPSFSYDVVSCSYDMTATIGEDGEIRATTSNGESCEIDLMFSNPIEFINPNSNSNDYANVIYKKDTTWKDYKVFKTEDINLNFKYVSCSYDGFNVYTKTPRMVKVLPYINEIDGIGLYKTANKGNEFGGNKFGDGMSLDDAMNKITIFSFNNPKRNFLTGKKASVTVPSGVSLEEEFETKNGRKINIRDVSLYFKKNGEYLLSDDTDFANITFQTNGKLNSDTVHAITILVERELESYETDNLTKHIRVIETSDIIDCREVRLMVVSSDTYVILTTNVSTGEEEEGGGEETTPEDEEETKMYQQVITFRMYFDTKASIAIDKRQNGAFADYEMMSYIFRFHDRRSSYDISPFEVTNSTPEGVENYFTLDFKCQWTADMNIIGDSQWKESTKCEMYAKTSSNFTYKIPFVLKFKAQWYDGGSTSDKGKMSQAKAKMREYNEQNEGPIYNTELELNFLS